MSIKDQVTTIGNLRLKAKVWNNLIGKWIKKNVQNGCSGNI
jgi:hypothetical protein